MGVGIAIRAAIGIALQNIPVWIGLGVAIGYSLSKSKK